MSNNILFILEGADTEKQIISKLKNEIFAKEAGTIIHLYFDAEIYQLWKLIKDDGDLDIVEVLRERSRKSDSNVMPHNLNVLSNLTRGNVAQIYLFFDYDGQASTASTDNLGAMLDIFREETEHGQLYISYPMVEALKDIEDEAGYEHKTVPHNIKGTPYKSKVNQRSPFQDIRKISKENWKFLASANAKKANLVVTGNYAIPADLNKQQAIFQGQLDRFISPHNEVAVLSAFPLFLLEYFGKDFLSS